jgi:membrane fusion protein (multidrug efflux system)
MPGDSLRMRGDSSGQRSRTREHVRFPDKFLNGGALNVSTWCRRRPCGFAKHRTICDILLPIGETPATNRQVGWPSAILVIVLFISGCSSGSQRPNAEHAAPSVVGVLKIQPRTASIYRTYVAHISALYTVDVRSRVDGELLNFHFRDGEMVHKGHLLFTIDPAPYRLALQSAQAQISKSESDVAESRAQLEKSKKDVQRYEPLVKIHAIPEENLTDAQAAAQVRDAQLKQSLAEVEVQRAAASQAELNLRHTRIYAPISGIIGDRRVSPGNLVSAGNTMPLATISSTDPMLVGFAVGDAEYLKYFASRTGKPSRPGSTHYKLLLADGSTYPFPGQFLYVSRELNQKTDTLTIVLRFPNPHNVLRPGEFAKVTADLEQAPDALLVPVVAVETIQGTQRVLMVDPSNKVVQRTITTSSRQGENYVVSGGLKPGDQVIVEGQQKVAPGDAVKPHYVSLDAVS